MATEVSACSCKFDYQDKLYGKGQRLQDLRVNSKCVPVWTCSNCAKTKVNYNKKK